MSSSAITQRPGPGLRRKILWWWVATFLWLTCQALFSTDVFSAEHTGTILWRIVHAIYSAISPSTFETIHFLIRKTAHFTTYGLLSVFAFFAWRATLPASARWTFRWSMLAVITAFIAGSLDEFHQSFVASRTSSFRDVLLDTFGAICFQLVLATLLKRKQRRADVFS